MADVSNSHEIANAYTHHPPKDGQPRKYELIRATGKHLASTILEKCPPSAERTRAIRRVQEAVMWANASIAINE